jgi:hypothetical protein
MANRYAHGVVSASVAATGGGFAAEFACSARATLRAVEVSWATGVTPVIGLGRPGNTPTGGTASVPPPTDPADSATTTINTYVAGHTLAPTVPAAFMKRTSIAAALGNGWVWNFEPDKWIIGPTRNLSLVLWIISLSAATATTLNVNVEYAD